MQSNLTNLKNMKNYKTSFEETRAVVTLDGTVVRTYEKYPWVDPKQFRRCVEKENSVSLRLI